MSKDVVATKEEIEQLVQGIIEQLKLTGMEILALKECLQAFYEAAQKKTN